MTIINSEKIEIEIQEQKMEKPGAKYLVLIKTNNNGFTKYDGKLKLILTGFSEAAIAAHACYEKVFPGKALHFEYSTTKGINSL